MALAILRIEIRRIFEREAEWQTCLLARPLLVHRPPPDRHFRLSAPLQTTPIDPDEN